jgi:hypothetical protein
MRIVGHDITYNTTLYITIYLVGTTSYYVP